MRILALFAATLLVGCTAEQEPPPSSAPLAQCYLQTFPEIFSNEVEVTALGFATTLDLEIEYNPAVFNSAGFVLVRLHDRETCALTYRNLVDMRPKGGVWRLLVKGRQIVGVKIVRRGSVITKIGLGGTKT